MRNIFAIIITGLAISLGCSGTSQASLIVTWEDVGGDLMLSIDGTWSDWDAVAVLTTRDNLLFEDNATTSHEFDLSRGGIGPASGQGVLLDVVSGSGSVSAPDFDFSPFPDPSTGYNLEYLNLGGALALNAEVISSATFTINESFSLGSTFSLTPGTRTFSSSTMGHSETLTMNFIGSGSSVPEPSSFALAGIGLGLLTLARRRRKLKESTTSHN